MLKSSVDGTGDLFECKPPWSKTSVCFVTSVFFILECKNATERIGDP